MFAQINNENGVLTFSRNIIDQVVRDAFIPFKAKCWGGKYIGPGADAMYRLNMLDAPGVKEISYGEEGVFIKVHVIIKLGTPIRKTLESLISSMALDITECLELPIDNIVIKLTAVAGNRNVAKRDISLDYYGHYIHAEDEKDE